MDALTLLKADHQAVEEKFVKFEDLGPRALKTKAGPDRRRDRGVVSSPPSSRRSCCIRAIRDRLADEEGQVLEALEEHHVVKWTLSELDGMSPEHERFDAKFTVPDRECSPPREGRGGRSSSPSFGRASAGPSSPTSVRRWHRPVDGTDEAPSALARRAADERSGRHGDVPVRRAADRRRCNHAQFLGLALIRGRGLGDGRTAL
jgi:hypothetical protein